MSEEEQSIVQEIMQILQQPLMPLKVVEVEGKYLWRAFDRSGVETTFVKAFEHGFFAYSEVLMVLIAASGGHMELDRLQYLQEWSDKQSPGGKSKRNLQAEHTDHEQRLQEQGFDQYAIQLLLTLRSRYGRNAATISESLAYHLLGLKKSK